MKILITAAEEEELITAKQAYNSLPSEIKERLDITFMLTGIGCTSTSYRLTKMLCSSGPFNFALNIGIAGSFTESFPIGSVAMIDKEYFGDLGFETYFGFQTLFDYNALNADSFPFKGGALYCKDIPPEIENALSSYKRATGVTVQTVSGLPEKKELLKNIFSPEIESMEGAAFFYVCLHEKVQFAEIRSVSNFVGERDRKKWDIPLALDSLREAVRKMLVAL